MRHTEIFKEAKRLHKLGFAIIWLHPKSKRPVEKGWTTGPRSTWEYLETTYMEGLNVGVRLGQPSALGSKKGFLAVVDVDVKSTDKRHRLEAIAAAKALLGGIECPMVRSGRGGGSRHYYCLTERPFKTFNPAASPEYVRYISPSKKPSKKELESLEPEAIAAGVRLARAWEVSLYSDGRQVVLPPSVHPDSGQPYTWAKHLNYVADLPVVAFQLPEEVGKNENSKDVASDVPTVGRLDGFDFHVEAVDLGWLPISDRVKAGIITGEGVTDRSGFLLQASAALISAGLNQNEVLTVLTDRDTYLGNTAFDAGHANTNDRGRAAAWVYRYTLEKVAKERDASYIFSQAPPYEPPRLLTPEEQAVQDAEMREERNWRQDLVRSASGVLASLVGNVVLILKNAISPSVVRRDEFAFRDTYSVDTPWGGKAGGIIADDDVANIKYWLGQEFGFEPKKEVIYDALTVIACHNAYDPVKDMLGSMPAWDQVPRLNTWLRDNFEAEGDEEYLAQVFRKWMFAMVLRVYRPGAKFDWMPIFEGAQGIGKSSFGRVLVGDKHFLDWLPNLNDKDSALSLQGMWGVEMGELSQFKKNELENIKAFISRTVDKMRPPYGRRLMESARRCVFFGTTNRERYLTDESGNRRFKPVKVGRLNFEALRKDRLQLFAEAKWLFDHDKETELSLELEGQAKLYEREIHGEKMVEDEAHWMLEAMQDFIEKAKTETVPFDFEKFRIMDLFGGGGPLSNWKADNRNMQYASKMLKRVKGRDRRINGRKFWKVDRIGHPPPTLDFF